MSKEMRQQIDKFKKILTENSAEKSNTFDPNELRQKALSYIDTNEGEIKNSMKYAYYDIVEEEIAYVDDDDTYNDAITFSKTKVEDVLTDVLNDLKRDISSMSAEEWKMDQERFAKQGITEINEFVDAFVRRHINVNAYEMLEDAVYGLIQEFMRARND